MVVGCVGQNASGDPAAQDANATTAEVTSMESVNTPPVGTKEARSPSADLPSDASHLPSRPTGEVEVISFDDLNIGLQPDVAFRPFMMSDHRADALIGRRVNVGGYMLAGDRATGIQDFILLKNLECKFGPGGMADHLIHVKLQDDVSASYTNKVLYIEGTLTLNPFQGPDGNTWSIYDLEGERVSTKPPRRR